MRKVLYIGHSFHLKTKSSHFFIDLLKKRFDIKFLWIDPYTESYEGLEDAKGQSFDMIILWQMALAPHFLYRNFTFTKAIYIPMYDGVSNLEGPKYSLFTTYKNFGIVCFSKTLYEGLVSRGYDAVYVQYFPEPQTVTEWGDTESIFFWQRLTSLNIRIVTRLLPNLSIRHIHIHKALDPGNRFVPPDTDSRYSYTYSEWFEDRQDMDKVLCDSAIYIAPRFMEGIGMGFLDAMAQGRCVIAPDVPTMNEYIVNGKNGLLYDIKAIQALKKADVRAMQKNALKTIADGYKCWQKDKVRLLDWLDEYCEKPPRTIETASEDFSLEVAALEEKTRKLSQYFRLLSKWLDVEIQAADFFAYFRKRGIQTVAIYGMGRIGRLIYDKLRKNGEIDVLYAIDKSLPLFFDLPVFKPTDSLPETDCIIVSINSQFGDIKTQLEKVTPIPVVCIDEIVNEASAENSK